MYAVTGVERERRMYISAIRKIMREELGFPDEKEEELNAIWREWVTLEKERDEKDLVTLLTSDVADAFKARALVVLSAPILGWAPFAWVKPRYAHSYRALYFAELPPSLREFGLRLLLHNADFAFAYAKTHDHDEYVQAWEWGTYPYYNATILATLECLSEDDPQAAALCERYELGGHRYEPFGGFMGSDLPEKWKWLIDRRMRKLITDEQNGCTERRHDSEPAVDRYLYFIGLRFYGDRSLPYSLELLASQVDFVLELPKTAGYRLFRCWRLDRVFLEVFVGNEHRERRHWLARSLLLDKRWPFTIHNGNDLTALHAIREEFGQRDPVLSAHIDVAFAELEQKRSSNEERITDKRAKSETMLAQMR